MYLSKNPSLMTSKSIVSVDQSTNQNARNDFSTNRLMVTSGSFYVKTLVTSNAIVVHTRLLINQQVHVHVWPTIPNWKYF